MQKCRFVRGSCGAGNPTVAPFQFRPATKQDGQIGHDLPVLHSRFGPVAVVVDPAVFERLVDDAEDALDRAELALAREQDDFVPWEQVKVELGLSCG